ncbi:MAG: hypothetical protein Q7U16_14575 [Agitococcus sp.]|nr:hypothetical protein [Agitococcus sp.]
MSENIDQFAIYSAKIFQLLYDYFPIPESIDHNEIICEYFTFDQSENLKVLKTKRDIASIIDATNDEELKSKIPKNLPVILEQITELEEAQRNDKDRQQQIYEGTLEFLTAEGLLRKYANGRYQLTSKGFSHLNKSFKDGGIVDDKDKTNISVLKAIFEKSSDTSLQVAAGTAVNVLTKILGY